MNKYPERDVRCTAVQFLAPGTRFALACDPEVTGVMLRTSDCSTTVALVSAKREVVLEGANGETRSFQAQNRRMTNWSPNTLVYDLGMNAKELERYEAIKARKVEHELKHGNAPPRPRSSKKIEQAIKAGVRAVKQEKAASKPAEKPVKEKPVKEGKKITCLDAVEKVLTETGKAHNAKELVELMQAKGYWAAKSSKAPHLSVQSAILHDIAKSESRFAKAEGGFTLSVL